MWPWVRAMFVDQLLGGGKLPSLPWAETVDTSALLVATLPLWLPLLAWTFLALAGFVWRLTKARGGLLATLVAPFLVRRAGRLLRRAFRQRRRLHATQPSGTLRRSMASVVNLQACAGVETAFSSEVPGAVSVEAFQAFKTRLSPMPKNTPADVDWQRMLDKETSVMTYRAWRNNLPSGAAEYLSVSVFENSSPLDLLEFFNDDSHRLQWDDMFIGFEILDSDPRTGAEVARWVRRFPLMCCPRDYVFARRSFVDGEDLYTITQACAYPGCPPRGGCRRVTEFFSAWRIRSVPGRNGSPACEVVLLHFEDMGIQHDLAKLAVRRGMWGCVLNLERGLCTHKQRRQERLRARVASRRSLTGSLSAPGTPQSGKRPGARASGGEPDAVRKTNLAGLLLRTTLMAVGGITIARHSARVGPQLVDTAKAVVVGHARHRQHRHRHHAEPSNAH
jgi:hypothetical protein